MLLNLIYGGAGCGKTQRCIELMQEAVEKKHNAILIVPDQYSYTAEKRITERFGGTGPNGAEVLTFSRLIK